MKTENILHSSLAVAFLFAAVAGSAQTGDYLYNGSEQTITLGSGLYDITAYGAEGGASYNGFYGGFGAEMEGQFDFATATTLTLMVGGAGGTGSSVSLNIYGGAGGGGSFVVYGATPFVVAGGGGGAGTSGNGADGVTGSSGGAGIGGGGVGGSGGSGSVSYGGGGGYSGNGGTPNAPVSGSGGGTSFVDGGRGGRITYLGDPEGGFGGGGAANISEGGGGGGYSGGGGGGGNNGGGGGGSIIDSSAIAIITEVSGVASPEGSPNGEIIITAVPEPTTLALGGMGALLLLFQRRRVNKLRILVNRIG